MKKIVSLTLVCLLLVGTMLSLVSCGNMLSGKYEYKLTDDITTTYEFSFNKVTKTATSGIAGFTKTETSEGKYKINEVENDKFEITFTWDVDGEEKIETLSFAKGSENGVDYIKIGGITFNKVD